MTRPTDWSPLAGSDPIGGDVSAVQTEAKYYSELAQEINDQVGRLRKIASQGEQIGKTADRLREAARSSADKIEQTHGRVAAVAGALTSWIPHLDTAQTDTLSALTMAKEAVQNQQANAAPPAGSPPPKTDAEKAADHARASRLDAANNELAAAKTKFDDAVAERDRQADKIAGQINDALHDGLKDGFWDHISNWVSQHVGLIKMVVEVLSWVATAVAIACIFIPGLNLLAIALTIGVLAGHALLASTGNGSWTDVVIDGFALATLGAGRAVAGLAKGARALTLARAGDLAASDAARGVTATRAALRLDYEQGASGLGKLTPKGFGKFLSVKTGLFDVVTGAKAGWASAGARTAMLNRELPQVTRIQSLESLGKDLAQNMKDIKTLRALYGDDAQFALRASMWEGQIRGGQVLVGGGQAVDLTNHAISRSEIPYVNFALRGLPPWERFKQLTTTGDSWAAGK